MKRFTLTVSQKSAEGKVGHAVGEDMEALGTARSADRGKCWLLGVWQALYSGRVLDFKEMNRRFIRS
jgi:hypothetical protein